MTGSHDVNNKPRSLRCSPIQRGVEVEVVEFGGNSRAAKLLMQCSEAMQRTHFSTIQDSFCCIDSNDFYWKTINYDAMQCNQCTMQSDFSY